MNASRTSISMNSKFQQAFRGWYKLKKSNVMGLGDQDYISDDVIIKNMKSHVLRRGGDLHIILDKI